MIVLGFSLILVLPGLIMPALVFYPRTSVDIMAIASNAGEIRARDRLGDR
jgi:hypothetical protein